MNASDILSTISLLFYSIVYFPQFYVIFKTKSSNGISVWTLILWTQADALSLFGTIILYLPFNFVIIGWYHFLIGVILIITVLIYKNPNDNNYTSDLYSSIVFIITNIVIGSVLNAFIKEQNESIGATLGWFTTALYLVGRFPQIYTNWKRKSTEGLSLLMYIFTILGNGFYIGVILTSPEYLMENMPWLITGIFSILLDIFIISQHYYYINLQTVKLTQLQTSIHF